MPRKQTIKPSAILLRAAEMVDDYNHARPGYDWLWEYGCHAIDKAAIEMGALEEDLNTGVRDQDSGLPEALPEVWKYFSLMAQFPGESGSWFEGLYSDRVGYSGPNHRVVALTMAAAIAEAEGQ
jgi:hypothetical protein